MVQFEEKGNNKDLVPYLAGLTRDLDALRFSHAQQIAYAGVFLQDYTARFGKPCREVDDSLRMLRDDVSKEFDRLDQLLRDILQLVTTF